MFLLWHPSLTAINLSYTFPILETSATALCGTTGIISIYFEKEFLFECFFHKKHGLLQRLPPPQKQQISHTKQQQVGCRLLASSWWWPVFGGWNEQHGTPASAHRGLNEKLRGESLGWKIWIQVFFLGGGFKCFIFTPIWGRFPFWLIFFRWVETTNQFLVEGSRNQRLCDFLFGEGMSCRWHGRVCLTGWNLKDGFGKLLIVTW